MTFFPSNVQTGLAHPRYTRSLKCVPLAFSSFNRRSDTKGGFVRVAVDILETLAMKPPGVYPGEKTTQFNTANE